MILCGEIRSESDELQSLQDKMEEWIENGVRLGWLLDLKNEIAYVYRAGGSAEVIEGLRHKLTGEDVMPGFTVDLSRLQRQ